MARTAAALREGALLLLCSGSAFLLLTVMLGASKRVFMLVQPRPLEEPQWLTALPAARLGEPLGQRVSSWQPAQAALENDEVPPPVCLFACL